MAGRLRDRTVIGIVAHMEEHRGSGPGARTAWATALLHSSALRWRTRIKDIVTNKSLFWLLGSAMAFLALPAYLRTAQTAPVPIGDAKQENAVALRVLFGLQSIHPKTLAGAM